MWADSRLSTLKILSEKSGLFPPGYQNDRFRFSFGRSTAEKSGNIVERLHPASSGGDPEMIRERPVEKVS